MGRASVGMWTEARSLCLLRWALSRPLSRYVNYASRPVVRCCLAGADLASMYGRAVMAPCSGVLLLRSVLFLPITRWIWFCKSGLRALRIFGWPCRYSYRTLWLLALVAFGEQM